MKTTKNGKDQQGKKQPLFNEKLTNFELMRIRGGDVPPPSPPPPLPPIGRDGH